MAFKGHEITEYTGGRSRFDVEREKTSDSRAPTDSILEALHSEMR